MLAYAVMRRLVLLTLAFVCVLATPVLAHTTFTPDEAGPGTIVRVTLNAADERDDAVITGVELFFPEGVTIPAGELASDGPGWTGTVFPDRIQWTGGTADGDQRFPMSLGPLPDQPGRLQFKVLQTYGNGDVDRWIQDWPAGAPEPDMPGPVLDLVPGAPGTVSETTLPPATTVPPTTTTTAAPTTTTTDAPADAGDDGDDDGLSAGAIVAIAAATAALGAGGVLLALRARGR